MSYCRCGEESDVYVWYGKSYNVNLGLGNYDLDEIVNEHGLSDKSFNTVAETINYLLDIKSLGIKVPNSAILKLQNEL